MLKIFILHTFKKTCYKTINPNSIALKVGTINILVNFRTKFCMDLLNVQNVINDHLRE